MDALDIRILRTLGVYPFTEGARGAHVLKPAHVAKALGVTLDTAKQRIRRLEERGVIRGYEAHPNLRHLGLSQGVFRFVTRAADKAAALEAVARLDGVGDVMDFVGTGFDVTVHYRAHAELARKLDLVATIGNAEATERYVEPVSPPVTRALTLLDWRIVRALRGRARRDPADVARDVGVSRRTVVRRVEAMCRDGGLDLQPIVDPGLMENTIPMCLVCRFREGGNGGARAVFRAIHERVVYEWTPAPDAPGLVRISAFAFSLQDAEDVRRRALAADGVASVHAQFPSRAAWNRAWIDEAIDARIDALAAERVSMHGGATPVPGHDEA